jgi:hypothetical protein
MTEENSEDTENSAIRQEDPEKCASRAADCINSQYDA